jgi:hypothetical protein
MCAGPTLIAALPEPPRPWHFLVSHRACAYTVVVTVVAVVVVVELELQVEMGHG